MNLLITGALGFVGVNLVRVLAADQNIHVTAADLRAPDAVTARFLAPVAHRVTFAPLDVTDRAAVHALVSARRTTHIVHAAAVTPDVTQERATPTAIVDVNLGGAINILDATVHQLSVRRTLVLSSSGVYAPASPGDLTPQAEDDELAMDSLYASTKHSAELLAARYAAASGKSMAALRLGPMVGPLERTSPTRQRVTPVRQLAEAWRDARAVTVAGPDVSRDWTYADDVAGAVLALLRAAPLRHSVYNVSGGRAYSFRSVVDAFVRRGLQATWTEQPDQADIAMRAHQVRRPLGITRLQQDAGFVPAYDLQAGVDALLAALRDEASA